MNWDIVTKFVSRKLGVTGLAIVAIAGAFGAVSIYHALVIGAVAVVFTAGQALIDWQKEKNKGKE